MDINSLTKQQLIDKLNTLIHLTKLYTAAIDDIKKMNSEVEAIDLFRRGYGSGEHSGDMLCIQMYSGIEKMAEILGAKVDTAVFPSGRKPKYDIIGFAYNDIYFFQIKGD